MVDPVVTRDEMLRRLDDLEASLPKRKTVLTRPMLMILDAYGPPCDWEALKPYLVPGTDQMTVEATRLLLDAWEAQDAIPEVPKIRGMSGRGE